MNQFGKALLFYFAIPLVIIFGVSTCVTLYVSYSAEKEGAVKSSFEIHPSSLKLDPISKPVQEATAPPATQQAVEVAPDEPILAELEQVTVDPKIKAEQPKAIEKPKWDQPLIAPSPKDKKLVKIPVAEHPNAKQPVKTAMNKPKPTNPSPKSQNPPKSSTTAKKVSVSAGSVKMSSPNQTGEITHYGIHPGQNERYLSVYLYPGKYKLTVKSFPESNHPVTFNFYDGAWHVSDINHTPTFYYSIPSEGWYKITMQCEYMQDADCRANAYLYRQ
jgi:hypothetical protein